MEKEKKIRMILAVGKEILLFLIIGLIYLWFVRSFGWGIPCFFRMCTGMRCPGCGMTHAIVALSHGQISMAFHYNALSITLLPIIMIYFLYRHIREKYLHQKNFKVWEYVFLIVIVLIVVIYTYVRNV